MVDDMKILLKSIIKLNTPVRRKKKQTHMPAPWSKVEKYKRIKKEYGF